MIENLPRRLHYKSSQLFKEEAVFIHLKEVQRREGKICTPISRDQCYTNTRSRPGYYKKIKVTVPDECRGKNLLQNTNK